MSLTPVATSGPMRYHTSTMRITTSTRRRLAFALTAFSFIAAPLHGRAATAAHSLPRPNNAGAITFYLDTPTDTATYPVVALLQGSDCNSVQGKYREFAFFITQILKMAVLSVEKPGFPSTEPGCPREYLARNTIDQRLEDFQTVIAHLRAHEQYWDHRLYLEGGSEGAVVAGLLAPQIPETQALMLLAGGGGRTMAEELLLLRRKELTAQGAPEPQVSQALATMRAQFAEIRANPESTRTWFGETNTYKWWNSILSRDLNSPLRQTSMPLYIAQGTADTAVPVESTDELIATLTQSKRNQLTYVRREGLTHSWDNPVTGQNFAEQTFSSTIIWLMVREDQELRNKVTDLLKQDPKHPDLEKLVRKMMAVDQRNTQAMKVLIARSGFPLISTHGAQANRDGWLLVQHADLDVEFQRSVLGVLEAALQKHDTNAGDVAYLIDRVMVNERAQKGLPAEQRFGTQGHVEGRCWLPWTIQDADSVDVRRAAYGLGTLADYIKLMNEFVGQPGC